MDLPPIPVSVHQEFPVQSQVQPGLTYIIKPLGNGNADQPAWNLLTRQIHRKRRPLIRQMREMILSYDFGDLYSPRDKSKIKEITEALLAEALGVESEDLDFLADVEGTIMDLSDDYADIALQDEEYEYDSRILNVAYLLVAIEQDGVRSTWPPRSLKERYRYLRGDSGQPGADPRDIQAMMLEGANLITLTGDAVKNYVPPSMSDSGLTPSASTENAP